MLIDWFTVGAQLLNFIVLVWLMKHFLYKPVLDAIDAREKRIAAEVADADKKKALAQSERKDLQQKNDAFDQERAALLAQATADAGAERKKLLDAAHQAADALTASRRQTMANDAKALSHSLRLRTLTEVFAVARQAMSDLATVDLEASVCELFIVRLRALEGTARADLSTALASSKDGALVRTAFELPTAQRTAVLKAVKETFSTQVTLYYEVAPELVGGIELSVHGQKFAWSIEGYLASLERGVSDLLKSAALPPEAVKSSAPAAAPAPTASPP